MKKGVIPSCLGLALVAAPMMAWADANPDFDDDAKPILRAQPGLVSYVRSHFEVKDTGKARYPGDDDHRPSPPYIFRARALGSNGPFNIRLLIEPGPPGHILCVVPPSGPGPGPSQQAPEPGYNQEPAPGYAQQQPGQEPPPPASDQQPQPSPYQPQEAQQPYQSPSLSQGDVKPLPPENTSAPEQNPAPAQQPAPPPSQPAPSPSEPTADTPSGPIMPSSSSSGTANPQPTLAPPPDPAPSGQ